MARTFIAANSQRFSKAVAPVTNADYTFFFSAWFKLATISVDQAILCVGTAGIFDDFWSLRMMSNDQFAATAKGSSTESQSTAGAVTDTTTWHHGLGIFRSNANRQGYLDGNAGTAATNAENLHTKDSVAVGAVFSTGGFTWFFDGDIAECFIGLGEPSAGEISSLANGTPPGQIRGIVARGWYPIDGRYSPEVDWSPQNNQLTVGGTGTPARSTHAPVGAPRVFGWRPYFRPSAAPPAGAKNYYAGGFANARRLTRGLAG